LSKREKPTMIRSIPPSTYISPSYFGELNDDLDVVWLPLESMIEVFRPLAPCDEARQPRTIRPGQGVSGPVPVPLVGVHAADDDIVVEHHSSRLEIESHAEYRPARDHVVAEPRVAAAGLVVHAEGPVS
jgi:hypothetical protein